MKGRGSTGSRVRDSRSSALHATSGSIAWNCSTSGSGWLEFEVTCSKGTYVRSLAEDLARALGTVGHVGSLAAYRVRPVLGRRVHTLGEIEHAAGGPDLEALLLAVDAALPGLPAIQLGESEQVLDPSRADRPGRARAARVRMYGVGGRFLGVGRMAPMGPARPGRIIVELPEVPILRA